MRHRARPRQQLRAGLRGSAPLSRVAALALVGLTLAAVPARADECILDHCADKRPPVSDTASSGDGNRRGAQPRGASRPGDFDFYVLALSWAPGFCAVGGGDEKGRNQCRPGADLGFTVHGLWPQYEHGFPSDCRGDTYPPRAALAATRGVYPEEGLARYEWRKHGTCSGLAPAAYFAAARAAREAVTIPPRFAAPHADQHLSPRDVVGAFLDSNPRLRPGMVAAICRGGTLDEVRVCFSKDLKGFQPCPEIVRHGCRAGDLDVPPVR